jgi:hypothetical protein
MHEDNYWMEVLKSISPLLTMGSFWKVKSPTVYESLAMILSGLQDFGHPITAELFKALQNSYNGVCKYKSLNCRHFLPGLPVADGYMFHTKFLFHLNTCTRNEFRETLYTWLSSGDSTATFIESILEHTVNQSLHEIFSEESDEGMVLLDCLFERYHKENFEYIGQSDFELTYLKLFTMIRPNTFKLWMCSVTCKDQVNRLLDRLFTICTEESATTEHKKLAIMSLCKVAFTDESCLSNVSSFGHI